jgi:hypothetical protein
MWRSRVRSFPSSAGALLAAGLLLSGCSAAGVGESLPKSLGGLPEDAPARPASSGHFPAVHDMPPPRADHTLTPDQQTALESELKALRDRQSRQVQQEDAAEGQAEPAAKPPAKPPAKPATTRSTKPAAKTGESAAGAGRNP